MNLVLDANMKAIHKLYDKYSNNKMRKLPMEGAL